MEGKDLTVGSLKKNMLLLLIPLVLTNLLNSIYNLVDGIWIGNLVGQNGLAIVTNSYPIILIITSVITGISIGTSVLISQYYGAKELNKLKNIVNSSYIIVVCLTVFFSVLIYIFLNPIFKILSVPIEITSGVKEYLVIYMIGLVFNSVFTCIIQNIRAIGNSKVPMYFVLISTVINIILDPILINTRLQANGAAIATWIAMVISFILSIIYVQFKSQILKISISKEILDMSKIKEILKVSIPVIIENWFITLIIIVETLVSNQLGVLGSASYGVVGKIEQIIYIIGSSFNSMTTIVVGQFVGKKMFNKGKNIITDAISIGALPTLFIFCIIYIFPRYMCYIFIKDIEVIDLSIIYLKYVGIGLILQLYRQVFNGYICGYGKTKRVLFSTIISGIVEIGLIVILMRFDINKLKVLGISVTGFVITKLSIDLLYTLIGKWDGAILKKFDKKENENA